MTRICSVDAGKNFTQEQLAQAIKLRSGESGEEKVKPKEEIKRVNQQYLIDRRALIRPLLRSSFYGP